MKKNNIVIFIVLALGITWALWIPALLLVSSKGYPLPTIDTLMQHGSFSFQGAEHVLAVVLFSLAVYGPLLAGLVAAWLGGGQRSVREWFAPTLRLPNSPRWFWLALAVALGLVLTPLAVGAITGLVTLRPEAALPSIALILGLFVYQLLTSGLGEEPGWRGYLLPHLQLTHGSEKAIWWTGLVWAVWHFPFTIYYTLQGVSGMEPAAQLSVLLPALLGQTASLVGMSYIYAWLINGSRSILIAVIFHALGNTFNATANAVLIANPVISLAIAAMPWLVVWLLEKTGAQKKASPNEQKTVGT